MGAAQGGRTPEDLLQTSLNISAFYEDSGGEIYVVDYGDGHIYRLDQAS